MKIRIDIPKPRSTADALVESARVGPASGPAIDANGRTEQVGLVGRRDAQPVQAFATASASAAWWIGPRSRGPTSGLSFV